MSKTVTYMKTHQSIFVPGLGDLGTTLPSSSKSIPNLTMTDVDTAVVVTVRNFTIKIPYGNIGLMVLAKESPTSSPANVASKAVKESLKAA